LKLGMLLQRALLHTGNSSTLSLLSLLLPTARRDTTFEV
jgi:hypothetical protein